MRGTHLRHPFGAYEGAGFDGPETGLCESLYEVDLGGQRYGLLLVLEAVAGPNLDDLDAIVERLLGATVGCGREPSEVPRLQSPDEGPSERWCESDHVGQLIGSRHQLGVLFFGRMSRGEMRCR